MIAGLLLGAGVGAGVLLVVRALRPRHERLADALTRLDPVLARTVPRADRPATAMLDRLGARALPLVGSMPERARPEDLRITGRTPARHTAERIVATAAGFAVPVLLSLLVTAAGGAIVPPGIAISAGACFGAAGWFVPDLALRDQARHRREAFRHALSSFLDLVNVVLAGGAGVETALEAAADAGDGWAFSELRAALARARLTRSSPWDAFADLGRELGVDELVELAASVRLAGEQGARIKASLAAKAASLRGHQLAHVEAQAQAASERMALPTVFLFTGFLVFIGYPAVAQILGGSGL